ncbi:hypothetical protein [Streptomyces violaceusniger]|uniref:WDGH domain-containing protein n=1 Tax=Streptomyces violaceusniger (strain Tu 4113) TaxID=653045 RepID=G2PHJ2_STRV4|nr:hypothetical protein [Streptomyces violaceusniger]AEM88995.1 hypothetical protein Strvi_0222 [Streptomyces violaceusniger Tu 4113]
MNLATVDPDGVTRSLAVIVQSLDRCRHGRHVVDPCGSCPNGLSEGNPHLKPGQKVGYDVHGETLYVPGPDHLSDARAWRTLPKDAAAGDDPLLNRAYRERNRLVAGYTRHWPSVITEAPDYPGFWIVYLVSPAGQLSWHIPQEDMDLFKHVRRVDTWAWDGHTTQQKYERLNAACAMWEGRA